jgi:hypothetical protein
VDTGPTTASRAAISALGLGRHASRGRGTSAHRQAIRQQQVDRAAAVNREAVVDLASLLGDMDMDGTALRQFQDRRDLLIGRRRAQAVGRYAD